MDAYTYNKCYYAHLLFIGS